MVVAASSMGLVDIAGLNIFSPDAPPPAYTAVIDRVDFNRIGNLLYILPYSEESEYFGEMVAKLYAENDETPVMSVEFGGMLTETMIVFDVEGLSGNYELVVASNQSAGEDQPPQEEDVILYRAVIRL